MIPGGGALSCLGFAHWNTVPFGKRAQSFGSTAIEDSSARNDNRSLRSHQEAYSRGQLCIVRRSCPVLDDRIFKKVYRIIKRLRLNILRECQRDWSAQGGVGKRAHRA